jgi:hypothetical protein
MSHAMTHSTPRKTSLRTFARHHLTPIGLLRFGWRVWLRDLAHACVVVLFATLVATAFSTVFLPLWR